MPGSPRIDEERLARFAESFSGELFRPGDNGYDQARRIFNGLVDRHPALIARCRGSADVVNTLVLARESDRDVSVRGGGHNVSGRAVTDGGVMIDLTPMKAVHVDPQARTARAGGGVTWQEFNDVTAEHGLATTGGVISTTGVAGLTLGGGLGWLMGTHGLSVDNLLSVELVTAAGDVVLVTADEYPDLFWALRGGGGNFGVATSFEFRLHPLRQVYGGLVAHPFDAARDALSFFRQFAGSVPDALSVMPLLVHAPDGSGVPLVAFAVCHTGPPDRAQADLEPLLSFGSPALVQLGPMSYPAVNTMLDEGFPAGALYYWKSSFMADLDENVIDTLIDRFATCPSPMTGIAIEHFHGAVTRVAVEATAVPHREPGFDLLIASGWTDPSATTANVDWTRETYAAVEPHLARRRYVNYLDHDDASDAVRAAYGPNFDRLSQVKRMYDPNNVFRLNHNIEPAATV
ncbi:MAG: FAD-binding oxidoreductase [Actinomycetota bacterium]